MKRSVFFIVVGAAGLVIFAGTLAELVLGGQTITVKLDAAADPDAGGRAHLRLRKESPAFLDIEAHQLDASSNFDLVVDDIKVATFRTNDEGAGRIFFRDPPRSHELMLGFDPRGALISLRNAAGEDVLVGTVPSSAGKSVGAQRGDPEGALRRSAQPHGEDCQLHPCVAPEEPVPS